MATPKYYPHITGIHEGALAVSALLDPGPNLPECARIIVGSPRSTPTIDGYIPDLGGFSCGPDAAERLIATLQDAVRDVRAAMAQAPAPSDPLAHAKRDEWNRLLTAADPAPWRFELGTSGLVGRGHVLTSAPSDKPWSDAPILCSHLFGPRDEANYALMAAAPSAISELLSEVTRLDSDKAECDRVNLASMAHIQGLEMQLRFLRLECGNRKAALAVACELIGSLQVERASNAQAFASPADRIANLEHELADVRESETTQATRIERLIAEHHAATTEVAELRERMESWVRASGAAR